MAEQVGLKSRAGDRSTRTHSLGLHHLVNGINTERQHANLSCRDCRGREDQRVRVLRLTLLTPDIVEAVLNGRQPAQVTLAGLTEPFPVEWDSQHVSLEKCSPFESDLSPSRTRLVAFSTLGSFVLHPEPTVAWQRGFERTLQDIEWRQRDGSDHPIVGLFAFYRMHLVGVQTGRFRACVSHDVRPTAWLPACPALSRPHPRACPRARRTARSPRFIYGLLSLACP
jgi:hypothetical protein